MRQTIARIAGEPIARLEDPAEPHEAAGRPEGNGRRALQPLRPLGAPAADRALGGGIAAGGLTEIHSDETRGAGTLAGFALALALRLGAGTARPLLWLAPSHALREAGLPYGPGLAGFGFDPAALLLVRTRRLEEAVWAGEEAASCRALSVVVLEVRGNPGRLALEGTRRLHVRAREAGVALLLLRQNAAPEPTAAPLRLRVAPGSASPVADLAEAPRLLGAPLFQIALEKSRSGPPQRFTLEWNPHERRFDEPRPGARQPLSRPQPALPLDGQGAAGRSGTLVALARREPGPLARAG
ncbi:hypothetical protein ASG48_09605 [Aurantimonas sp. Leaf443]|nr:hypothetical protein ASG48_09605 [Aurantimonas sp. Leaf443]